jgi:preprotein translocase subunit SecD
MKLIFQLVTFCLLAFGISAADSTKQSVLQFRLVVENPTANSEQVILSQKNLEEKLQVQKDCLLDASTIKSARVIVTTNFQSWQNESGKWETSTNIGPRINIDFTDAGGKKLEEVTSQHIGERLAIFIDGKIWSAPRIQSPISGGKAQIAGNFTGKEAEDLAQKINDAVVK